MSSRAERMAARAQNDFLAEQQALRGRGAGRGRGGSGRSAGGSGGRHAGTRQGRGGQDSLASQLQVAQETIAALQADNKRTLKKLNTMERVLASQKVSSNKRMAEQSPVLSTKSRKSARGRSSSPHMTEVDEVSSFEDEEYVENEDEEEDDTIPAREAGTNPAVQRSTEASTLVQDLLGLAQTSSTQASLRSVDMDRTVAENISKDGKGRLQAGKMSAYQTLVNFKGVWVAMTAEEFYRFIACPAAVSIHAFAPLQHHFSGAELAAKIREASSGPVPQACAEREMIIGSDMARLHKALRNAVFALGAAYNLVDGYLKEGLRAADRVAEFVTEHNWGQSVSGLPFTIDLIKAAGIYFLGALEGFVLKMSITRLSSESIIQALQSIPDPDESVCQLFVHKKMLDARYYHALSATSPRGSLNSSSATVSKKALKVAKQKVSSTSTNVAGSQGVSSKPAAGRVVVTQTGSTRSDGKYCLDFMTTGCTRAKCSFSHVVPVPAAHQPLIKALFAKNPTRVPLPEFSF